MATKNQLHQELKRNFVLEKLLEAGVTKSRDGIDLHDCDYKQLKHEWVMFSVREIDVEKDENKWF